MSFVTKNYQNVVGDDITRDFVITAKTGNLANGTHKLILTIRTKYADNSQTTDTGVDVILTSNNTQTASSSASLTFPIALDFDGKIVGTFFYDVKWIQPSGESQVMQRGMYILLPRVTVTDV